MLILLKNKKNIILIFFQTKHTLKTQPLSHFQTAYKSQL
jgi:hypothetical protein